MVVVVVVLWVAIVTMLIQIYAENVRGSAVSNVVNLHWL